MAVHAFEPVSGSHKPDVFLDEGDDGKAPGNLQPNASDSFGTCVRLYSDSGGPGPLGMNGWDRELTATRNGLFSGDVRLGLLLRNRRW